MFSRFVSFSPICLLTVGSRNIDFLDFYCIALYSRVNVGHVRFENKKHRGSFTCLFSGKFFMLLKNIL